MPGTFDLLHYGHMRFLKECAYLGHVTVALSTDANAERWKRRPIMSFDERAEALLHLPYVDVVVPKDRKELYPIFFNIGGDLIAYGSDWMLTEWMEANHIRPWMVTEDQLVEIHNERVVSTTEIIARAAR